MKSKNGKNVLPVQKPLSPTHRFFQKLGYKDQELLRFVLVHDAKNSYYQRYSNSNSNGNNNNNKNNNNNGNNNNNNNNGNGISNGNGNVNRYRYGNSPYGNSPYGKVPAMTLYKPFNQLERHVPFMTLYDNYRRPVHLFNQNSQGYAIFMEVNYRESRQTAFKDIRAQFIDVDLNKVSAIRDTHQQAMEKAKSLRSSPSERIASVTITRTANGRYLLLAERTRERVEQLKKSFLRRHRSKIKNAMVVETKNGFHMYWPVQEGSIDQFVPIQKALVKKFSSDPNITNLGRAMRVPGFFHMKDPDDPFMVKVKHWGRSKPYTQNELVRSLQLNVGGGGNARRALAIPINHIAQQVFQKSGAPR